MRGGSGAVKWVFTTGNRIATKGEDGVDFSFSFLKRKVDTIKIRA